MESFHARCIDNRSLAGISSGTAEIEVTGLQMSDANFPNPSYGPPVFDTSHVNAVLLCQHIANRYVSARFDQMTFWIVLF